MSGHFIRFSCLPFLCCLPSIHPREFPMALERESIMVTDTLNIQRLFASWKSQWTRRGVDIQRIWTISLLLRARVRSPQKRERERDSLEHKREHSRVSWQLYAQRKSLSNIFYSIRPGGLFRARVRKRVTLLETPVSPLSLSVERNQGPFSNLNHRRCAPKLDELVKSEKTRRAYSAVHRLHELFKRK